jgi:heavy metal translocating P-type ATPase
MTIGRYLSRYIETGVCLASIGIGGVLWSIDLDLYAARSWLLGASVVLIAAIAETGIALSRKEAGLDLLAIAAIGGAIALNETLTAAIISLMYSSGRTLEDFAERRARQEMSALLAKAPHFANRYDGAVISRIRLEQVVPGDRLLVKAGETLPVDGTLLSALAVIDASSLTGESMPVSYAAGSALQSGTVNAAEAFDLQATHGAQDSTFSGVVRLVESAQRSRAPAMRLADRYALLLIPLAGIAAGLAWWLTGDPQRALAVVVVATPCPLILAVPVAIVCAMSRCAKHGVLIKQGGAIEKLAAARILFLDKTGTLTSGNARLVSMETTSEAEQSEVLRLAASLEQWSSHVVAQAVVHAARERGLTLTVPEQVQEVAGEGLSGMVDGKSVRVGSLKFATQGCGTPGWAERFAGRVGDDGAAGVFISVGGILCGAIEMADEIRLDAPRAVRLLRAAGISHVHMLTGDRVDVATTIGRLLGVDVVMAAQTPESKLTAIREARKMGTTIMVGDGINDSPALAAADVGVAMGARGATAAAEAAQVVLLVDRLDRLAFAVKLARRTKSIALQSVYAGMGLSFVAMAIAAFGYLPPVAGAILQEVIDIAVIFNALRVLRPGSTERRLSVEEASRLKGEHVPLMPIIDRLVRLADQAGTMPAATIRHELLALSALLHEQLLPHESNDDAALYPELSQIIGGEDPMAAMSSAHREIYRLSSLLDRSARNESYDDAALSDVRRTLYSLDAVLRLHFAQEEEIYHGLSS